ncbi:MAG: hypothetical protein JXR84_20305 [Anaerolineae bacterium]|nr:hypothetical protein [Anaerolineae bacterium]
MDMNEDVALNARHIQRRVQVAIERVAEDPALTGALVDDEALILLHWAETEIERLVLETADMDDTEAWEQLSPALHTLRLYIRRTANTSADADDPVGMLHLLLASPPIYTEEM